MSLVTEMSEISVTNFTADKTQIVPGDTVTLSVKLKNISGAAIRVWSVAIGVDARQFTDDSRKTWYTYPVGSQATREPISWAAGATKVFSWVITLDQDALTPFLQYGARAVPLMMKIISGTVDSLGEDTYVSDTVTVLNAKFSPGIDAFEVARALDDVPNDEGTQLLTTLKLSQSTYASDYIFAPECKVFYRPQDNSAGDSVIDLTNEIQTLLSGVIDDPNIIPAEFSTGTGYDFMLDFGDEYEKATLSIDIDRVFANVAMSEYGAGVSLGMFPTSTEKEPKFESAYTGYLYGGVETFGGGAFCEKTQSALGIQCGQVPQQGNTVGGDTRTIDVAFEKPYADGSIPTVFVCFRTSSSAATFGRCACSVANITNAGFEIRFYNGDDSNRNPGFNWISIGQMGGQ